MNEISDIYAISGRVKNIIAKEGIDLSPVGTILVNYYTLVLKDLHDFANNLPEPHRGQMLNLLLARENMPCNVIKVCMPNEEIEAIFDEGEYD